VPRRWERQTLRRHSPAPRHSPLLQQRCPDRDSQSGKLNACLFECVPDRFACAFPTAASRSSIAISAQQADPLVSMVAPLQANIDIAFAGVGLKQVENEQAWSLSHHRSLLYRAYASSMRREGAPAGAPPLSRLDSGCRAGWCVRLAVRAARGAEAACAGEQRLVSLGDREAVVVEDDIADDHAPVSVRTPGVFRVHTG
jgi:hypothetical protein